MSNKIKIIIITAIIVSAFISALFLGLYIGGKNNKQVPAINEKAELHQSQSEDHYKFINPLLECADIENASNKKINRIKLLAQDYVNKEMTNASDFISVYFRDLNNGPWFGINEKENFTPSSLLKVPLLISYLKLAEDQPEIIEQKVVYEKGFPGEIIQFYKPAREIEPGKEYAVRDLLEAMIKYSDNNAALFLSQIITPKQLEDSYSDLGIEKPMNQKYVMPVRTYASFFRILYNATYLNKPASELALALLSQTDFKDGLRAGVPADIAVAHKFGEQDMDEKNKKQLHDCGIIYYPDSPYILCLMTRGNDFNHLAGVIKHISQLVYSEMGKE